MIFIWIYLAVLVVVCWPSPAEPDPAPLGPPPTTHGSAEWASPEYLREHNLIGGDGLIVGVVPGEHGPEWLRYNGDRHLFTIAPTGSGKGTCAIVPNLLTYRGSALVVDPKGENAMITASARQRMGHTVHVVDPWGITGHTSSRFNPLDWLDLGDIEIGDNAMLLAEALVVPDGNSENRFFDEEAKGLLQGLILYVATDPHEQGDRHLGRVRDLMTLDGEDMPDLFQRMAQSPHRVVASAGARSLQKDPKLLSSVLSSAQANTRFLDSAHLRDSLSSSDFKFEDLKTGRITVYLVLPGGKLDGFGRWLRLLIQQAITVTVADTETKPDKRILFLLDELPALGKLSMIETAYGLMRGYGMQIWGIAQDTAQLKRIYGESWETFIGNSGAIQYFGGRDLVSAKYFSALCGQSTVWNLSSSTSFSTSYSKDGSSSTSGTTFNKSTAQRSLAFPDELMRMGPGAQLLFMEHHRPIIAGREPWFKNPTFRMLGRNLHRPLGQCDSRARREACPAAANLLARHPQIACAANARSATADRQPSVKGPKSWLKTAIAKFVR